MTGFVPRNANVTRGGVIIPGKDNHTCSIEDTNEWTVVDWRRTIGNLESNGPTPKSEQIRVMFEQRYGVDFDYPKLMSPQWSQFEFDISYIDLDGVWSEDDYIAAFDKCKGLSAETEVVQRMIQEGHLEAAVEILERYDEILLEFGGEEYLETVREKLEELDLAESLEVELDGDVDDAGVDENGEVLFGADGVVDEDTNQLTGKLADKKTAISVVHDADDDDGTIIFLDEQEEEEDDKSAYVD